MKGRKLIFLFITILFVSCQEKNFDPGFFGITETDETGVVLKSDTNDWKFEDVFTDREEALFDEVFDSTCSQENFYYRVVAYPNPCVDTCYFYIDIPMEHRFVYRIVDNDFNILYSGETTDRTLIINVSEFTTGPDVVRMYYKIFNHTCELRGHGDILIQ